MSLFDRDDDRGRGFRARYDRDLGRPRGGAAWDRLERGFRGRDPNDVGMRGDEHLRRDFESRSAMDYGADYGVRGRTGGYDRDLSPTEAGWRAGGMNRGGRDWNLGGGRPDLGHHWGSSGDYDRGYRGDWNRGGYGAEYGRGMRGAAWGREGRYGQGAGFDPGFPRDRGAYDRHEYKSRYQTDAGDPFGDRQRHTPIRMVNEDYADRLARRNAYDADIRHERDWF